ncbi:MAG: hypothetical protein EBY16_01595 [Gammaproteobacteria bacterium]|nr:hypothetical protein [Gammaproteobacteria bacterium]
MDFFYSLLVIIMPAIKLIEPVNRDALGRDITEYFSYRASIRDYQQFWLKKTDKREDDLNRIMDIISKDLMEKDYSEEGKSGQYNLRNNEGEIAYHPNHGTSHGLRQREYQIQYLELIKQQGSTEFQIAAQHLTEQELEIMKLSAFMHRLGRTNERGFFEDSLYGPRSQQIFTAIASDLGFEQSLIEFVAGTMSNFRSDDDLKKQNSHDCSADPVFTAFQDLPKGCARQKAILFERLIEMGHQTDLVRCWVQHQYGPVHAAISKRFDGILEDGCDPSQLTEKFLLMATELCKGSGAPIRLLKEHITPRDDAITISSACNLLDTKNRLHDLAQQFAVNSGILQHVAQLDEPSRDQGMLKDKGKKHMQLFRCDFKQGKTFIPANEQAVFILNEVLRLHQDPWYSSKKIGITYSANQYQTQTILQRYHSGAWKTGTNGSNQAAVIQEIERLLGQPRWQELQNVFRIVPFTTMKYVNKGVLDNSGQIRAADDDAVTTCLQNAEQFMAEGNLLLGWTHQDSPEKVAIGGGVAADVQPLAQKERIDAWLEKMQETYGCDRTPALALPSKAVDAGSYHKMNKIQNSYSYQIDSKAQGRSHKPFGFFPSLEVRFEQFQGLDAGYKGLSGDGLKSEILNTFQNEINQSNSIDTLKSIKQTLRASVEFTVLNTGQDLFTIIFGRLFGFKTSSVIAFEKMLDDMEERISYA